MTLWEVLIAGVLGLTAGTIGGLAGIGGSLIMLPGLVLLLGYADQANPDGAHAEQHLYMAAAMCVNVLVAIPAAMRHHKAGAVRWDLYPWILGAMAVGMVAGVLLGNGLEGDTLRLLLAGFIVAYALLNLWRVITNPPEQTDPGKERADHPRMCFIGGSAGFFGGLLGLGGGVVMVPLLQVMGRIRLREAIATSLTVMPITAAVGATVKVGSLGRHEVLGEPLQRIDVLWLVLAMGPMAVLGGRLGASLNHALPLRGVRAIVSVVLLIAAARMAVL